MGKPSSHVSQVDSIVIGDAASDSAQLTRRQVVGSALLAPAVLGAWAAAPDAVGAAERSYLQPQPEADWHAYLTVAERSLS